MSMAAQIGPVLRRLRERWRLTQQEVVEYARLDRSPSYISSVETGKTSPTLAELEALAIVFRTSVPDILREAQGEPDAAANDSATQRIVELCRQLDPESQALAEDLIRVLIDHARRHP